MALFAPRNILISTALVACATAAHAQLINQPFEFKNSPGGLGMSVGGQQAILNQKVLGVTPDNLVRGPSGTLLDVQKGPGDIAIVSRPGTNETIPTYRGTSFRGGNVEMSAGVFNAAFSPNGGGAVGGVYFQPTSDATVTTWTTRAVTNAPVSYLMGNSIEAWTGTVY